MVLAATTGTWGISGPTFLVGYVVVAVLVAVAGTRARHALTDPRPAHSAGDLASRPHDVAYLHGGAELAVYSALSAMHLRGTIAPRRGIVHAVGRLGPEADPLERAVHVTAAGGVHRNRLPFHGPVATALAAIEKRLVTAGLLLSDERRADIRRIGFWMLAVAALGLVRLLAGIAEARPVGLLLVALLAVTAVAAVQLARAPRRSRSGERALAALRTEHHDLSPTTAPDWVAHGPAAAALGIGIFGTSALWASDPAFADELAAQRVTSSGSDGGMVGSGDGGGSGSDGGGGGGGGCGGCGG